MERAKQLLETTTLSVSAIAVQPFLNLRTEWTVFPDGGLELCIDGERNMEFPELPRFGLRLFLPQELDQVRYYGCGPYESYADKHRASSHGAYASPVSRLHEDYIRPQENGSHFDCGYVTVQGGGLKLTAVSETAFSFNASLYTQEELTQKAARALDEMLHFGVTTCEAKSGYGLATEHELKALQVIQNLNDRHVMDIVATFMGATGGPA